MAVVCIAVWKRWRGRGQERAFLGRWSSSSKAQRHDGSRIFFKKKGTGVSEPKTRGRGMRERSWSRNDVVGVELVADAGPYFWADV